MGVSTSNLVIRWVNFLTMFLAIAVIGFGVWLSTHHDSCRRSLTFPVMGLGAVIFVISIVGFLGALKNNTILLWIYLIMLCSILVAILGFTVLAFIVTNGGSGHTVPGLRYKEYKLEDYSSWFLKQLNDTDKWNHLKSCLVKSDDCKNLPKKYKTLKKYKQAKLTPIEAGCCRPPSELVPLLPPPRLQVAVFSEFTEKSIVRDGALLHLLCRCGYPAINASYYDLSFHPSSSDSDCTLYKNSKTIKCYSCSSCKAGVAQYMKTEWRVVAIFNVALFVILLTVYFVGCCARRNAARTRSSFKV